ncbi:hypothetical protein LJC10_03325 [Selenomonadales bacterium OttesenSCG-928-I06]|nr:hypothetical protein [Selenomonadales bacterium OttesenSCG-928-I06]
MKYLNIFLSICLLITLTLFSTATIKAHEENINTEQYILENCDLNGMQSATTLYIYDQNIVLTKKVLVYNGQMFPERLLEALSVPLKVTIFTNNITFDEDKIIVDLNKYSSPISKRNKETYSDKWTYEQIVLNSIARTLQEHYRLYKPVFFTVEGRPYKLKSCKLSLKEPFINIEMKRAHENVK